MKYVNLMKRLLVAGLFILPTVSFGQSNFLKEYMQSYDSIANFRYYDQRGINVFETPKNNVTFNGLRVRFGAGFTQQFQNLSHSSEAEKNSGTGGNRLYPLAPGFMTAQANLFTDVQLAEGIRLNVTTYLSSRHHNEAWVKGGYIQIDKFPFKGKFWNTLSSISTVKVGHMEINYGDEHFRRSDGGQTLYNPFMDNLIMDSYATEIGGEYYLRYKGFFGMLGISGGMIKGNVDSIYMKDVLVDNDTRRSPSIYLKGGFDKNLMPNLRVRGSASWYHNSSSAGSGLTLFGGDRTGSNYQNVMEKGNPETGALPASTAIAFSGRFNPGMSKAVDAIMLNGFVKFHGLEVFATYETAKGYNKADSVQNKVVKLGTPNKRDANQFAIEGVYRFLKNENLFVGIRYNTVSARLTDTKAYTWAGNVTVTRMSYSAGWFITKNILLKGEIVNQQYNDFKYSYKGTGVVDDYRKGGKFNGYVIEAVVGF